MRAKRARGAWAPVNQARTAPGEAGREAGQNVRQDFCRAVLERLRLRVLAPLAAQDTRDLADRRVGFYREKDRWEEILESP